MSSLAYISRYHQRLCVCDDWNSIFSRFECFLDAGMELVETKRNKFQCIATPIHLFAQVIKYKEHEFWVPIVVFCVFWKGAKVGYEGICGLECTHREMWIVFLVFEHVCGVYLCGLNDFVNECVECRKDLSPYD